MIRTVLPVLLAGGIAIQAGCGRSGPRPVPASGKVLLDGRPLPGGYVRVVPEQGRAAGGRIDKQGRFTLGTFAEDDGCLPGTHGVEVTGAFRGGEGERAAAPGVTLPRRYADHRTSGLQVTIDGPTDALLIEIRTGGG